MKYGRCFVCGQGKHKRECGIVNWIYGSVWVGRLYLNMADVVCVVRGYLDVYVELLIGNKEQWDLGD